jgi:hypothetical protein
VLPEAENRIRWGGQVCKERKRTAPWFGRRSVDWSMVRIAGPSAGVCDFTRENLWEFQNGKKNAKSL